VTTSVHKLAPTEVELEIQVSPADFASAQDRAFRKLATRYRLPGFRPGHVPRRIFEQQVGKATIDHQALEDLVPEVYAKAVKEHRLEPVDRPHFDLDRSEADQGVRIKATVAVRPEIALADYRGIPVLGIPTVVTDEDVEHSIDSLRKKAAALEPVDDRPVQLGDHVTMDYTASVDGQPFEGGHAEQQTTEVAPGRLLDGFAEQLVGAVRGESRKVTITFATEHRNPQLAGKQALFDVMIHEIKQAVLPDLDDDFVRQISDHDSVATLRADVRRRLEAVAESRNREAVQKHVLDALLERNDFPLPDVLVNREVHNLVADAKAYMARIDRPWEEYLAAKGVDEAQLQDEYRAEAERRVKTALLLDEIAKQENIDVTTAEIERELDKLARAYDKSRDQMIDILRKSTGFGAIVDTVRQGKTLDFLVSQAEVTDVPAAAPAAEALAT